MYFVAAGFVMAMVSCGVSSSLMQPQEADRAKVSGENHPVTLADLQSGYKLYVTNCSGCHSLHKPVSHTAQEWEKLLPEMFKETSLNEKERSLVKDYILSKL